MTIMPFAHSRLSGYPAVLLYASIHLDILNSSYHSLLKGKSPRFWCWCCCCCFNIYLFVCARSQLQHVGSSSLTRCQTQAPCVGSRVLTTGPPGKSQNLVLGIPLKTLVLLYISTSQALFVCGGRVCPPLDLFWCIQGGKRSFSSHPLSTPFLAPVL